MLLSLSRKFIFLANLKTASTSVEQALGRYADIRLSQSQFGKHMSLAELLDRFAFIFDEQPFESFFSFAVVRHPVDRLHSLYRSHKAVAPYGNAALSTQALDFSGFLEEWLPKNPSQAISQTSLVCDPQGRAAVSELIPFEHFDTRCGAIVRGIRNRRLDFYRLPRANVSPKLPDISPDAAQKVAALYADDLELYQKALAGSEG